MNYVDRIADAVRGLQSAGSGRVVVVALDGRSGAFDWAAGHGLTGAITIEPRDLVVVEGVYAARPEFDDALDLRVLVELPDADRERRRNERPRTISRSDPQQWDARWDASEQHYFDRIRPADAFDLVVSGDG